MSTATVGSRVGHDPAFLQLTVDARLALPGLLGLRTTADLAALVAAVGSLGALSCVAVRNDVPLTGLVRRAASITRPPAYQGAEVTVWWAARAVWGLVLPDAAAKTATDTMVMETISPLGVRDDDVPVVKSVSYGSPLELVLQLPLDWFAAGGSGMLFLKAIEYWWNSPRRIRVESARLDAEQVQHEAERLEAEVRLLRAAQDLRALTTTEKPALLDATLTLP
jgi:hypothetical protein